jgi:hypothetical protein
MIAWLEEIEKCTLCSRIAQHVEKMRESTMKSLNVCLHGGHHYMGYGKNGNLWDGMSQEYKERLRGGKREG